MNVTVLGSGRWGTFLAVYHSRKNNVALWGKEGSPDYEQLLKERKNSYLELPDNLILEPDLGKALDHAEYIVISISAQHLREFCERINQYNVHGKTFILCMKGIESETGERLSQIVKDTIRQYVNICVWVGPGHVQDFMAGIPNCMVIDSDNEEVKKYLVDEFSSELIRFYIGTDLIGSEIGAAAKNVIGIRFNSNRLLTPSPLCLFGYFKHLFTVGCGKSLIRSLNRGEVRPGLRPVVKSVLKATVLHKVRQSYTVGFNGGRIFQHRYADYHKGNRYSNA